MDTNEVATLYGILDKNGDEQVTGRQKIDG